VVFQRRTGQCFDKFRQFFCRCDIEPAKQDATKTLELSFDEFPVARDPVLEVHSFGSGFDEQRYAVFSGEKTDPYRVELSDRCNTHIGSS